MRIFNFFGKKNSTENRSDSTLQRLKKKQLIVLCLNEGSEFSGDPQNEEDFIAWIKLNAEQAAAQEDLHPYHYEEGGRMFVPFFSSAQTAEEFVKSDPANQWKAFTTAEMEGIVLLEYLLGIPSDVTAVLDSRSPREQQFTQEQISSACS